MTLSLEIYSGTQQIDKDGIIVYKHTSPPTQHENLTHL